MNSIVQNLNYLGFTPTGTCPGQEGDASAEAIRLGLCFFSSMVFDDLDSKQKQLTLKKFAKLNINLAQPYNGLNTLSNLGQIAK